MRANRDHTVTTEILAAYLEGEVTRSEEAMIEQELASSATARHRLSDLRALRDALAAPVPEFESTDLVEALTRANAARAQQRESSSRSTPHRKTWWASGGLLAAAAGAALLIGQFEKPELDHPATVAPSAPPIVQFRAKGASYQGSRRGTWVGLQVFRVEQDGKPQRLGEYLAAGDGLLFSYNNLGEQPYRYLLVFGVDAEAGVRWYYPAYEREGDNPKAIGIAPGRAEQPLPELVRHDYPPGPLVIHAVFTDRCIGVLEVETAVLLRSDATSLLNLPDSAEQVIVTQVHSETGIAPTNTVPEPRELEYRVPIETRTD